MVYLLLALLPVAAWAQGTVSGRIVDALTGKPLPGTLVSIGSADRKAEIYFQSTSGAKGEFSFANIPAGDQYWLRATKRTYLQANLPKFAQQMPLVIGPQGLPAITLPMTPQSVLAGVLVDADGEPVPGESLSTLQVPSSREIQLNLSVGAGSLTNDLGKFRLAGLPAGEFRIMMSNTQELGRFTLAPGQSLKSLRVVRPSPNGYSIAGQLSRPVPQSSDVMLRLDTGSHLATVDPDGSFRFDGVPPGDYTIIANWSRPIVPFSFETARVTVTESNLRDVQLVPPARYTLRGRVQLKGPRRLPSITFVHRHSSHETFTAVPTADGSFAIPNFPAGPFTLQRNTPAGTYLEKIQQAGKSVGETFLDGGPVEVIFNAATAHLTGTVEPPSDDQPLRAGIVYLVPEGRWLGAGLNPERNQAIVSTDLSFSLADLAPGRYLVFVSEGILLEGVSADSLRSLGASVRTLTIAPNSRKKIVLPLIRVEKMVAAGVELSH